MNVGKAVSKAVGVLLSDTVHTATVYLSDTLTVRATRRLINGEIPRGRISRRDISLTIGRPNYKAREFIRKAIQAGEPFPIRQVQLTLPPKSRT